MTTIRSAEKSLGKIEGHEHVDRDIFWNLTIYGPIQENADMEKKLTWEF